MPLLPWTDAQPRLVEVAAGQAAADMVIRGGAWVSVHTREVIPHATIAMACGRIAAIGPEVTPLIGPRTEVIEAAGRFMIPGLIDAHMHVESGMLTPAGFAAAVIPRGTTTIFHDPHEIANVMGLEGVRLMRDESMLQPIGMFTQMPSCAPSAPGLETSGAVITEGEVAQAMGWGGIVGLGEMMNFPAVAAGDPQMLAEIAATRAAGKTVGGHYASPDLGPAFHAYAAGGAEDDHETTTESQAIARVRRGMTAMLRLGSAWHDVEAQITAVTRRGLDPRGFVLCTDDSHSGTLVHEGHMDRVVRHAIACGCDPVTAIQMATLNPATHFGLSRELGSLTPGRRADVILTPDLRSLAIDLVVAQGRRVAEGGRLLVDCPRIAWPEAARASVRLGGLPGAAAFATAATGDSAQVRVIGVIENQAPTRALTARLPVIAGRVALAEGLAHVAVLDRHTATGRISKGFVQGFGYGPGVAVASTVAHDCHQLLVVGTDPKAMAKAVAELDAMQGGIVVIRDGTVLARVHLSVAGLMSDRPAAEVAAEAQAMVEAMAACGCRLNNAFMQHSLLALAVIPELRITDLGLVDVGRFALVPVTADAGG